MRTVVSILSPPARRSCRQPATSCPYYPAAGKASASRCLRPKRAQHVNSIAFVIAIATNTNLIQFEEYARAVFMVVVILVRHAWLPLCYIHIASFTFGRNGILICTSHSDIIIFVCLFVC